MDVVVGGQDTDEALSGRDLLDVFFLLFPGGSLVVTELEGRYPSSSPPALLWRLMPVLSSTLKSVYYMFANGDDRNTRPI